MNLLNVHSFIYFKHIIIVAMIMFDIHIDKDQNILSYYRSPIRPL